jgi:hypothetical protein
MAIRRVIHKIETRVLPNAMKIDSVGPIGAAINCNIPGVGSDEKCIVVVGYR